MSGHRSDRGRQDWERSGGDRCARSGAGRRGRKRSGAGGVPGTEELRAGQGAGDDRESRVHRTGPGHGSQPGRVPGTTGIAGCAGCAGPDTDRGRAECR